jgi:hypothetical protein
MFGMRCWTKPEGINGTRNQGSRQQLRLGRERICSGIYKKTVGLEIVKKTARSSIRIQKMRDRTLYRGHHPSRTEKRAMGRKVRLIIEMVVHG